MTQQSHSTDKLRTIKEIIDGMPLKDLRSLTIKWEIFNTSPLKTAVPVVEVTYYPPHS